jgi:ankyrin repeat protein
LDLLARNIDGNTSLHLAIMQAEVELKARQASGRRNGTENNGFPVVKKLLDMVSPEPLKLTTLFQLTNKKGQTVLESCPNTKFGEALRLYLVSRSAKLPTEFPVGGVTLSRPSIQQISGDPTLQKVIAYWSHFHSRCDVLAPAVL